MFKPEAMKKVDLIVLKDSLDDVTKMLYDLKLIQFFKVKENSIGRFEKEDLKNVHSDLLKLRSSIDFLKKYFKGEENSKSVENPIKKTLEFKEKIKKLSEEIKSLEDDAKRDKVLIKLKLSEKDLKNKNLTIGFVNKKNSSFLKKYQRKKIRCSSYQDGRRLYFAIFSKDIDFDFKEFYMPKNILGNIELKLKEKKFKFEKELQKLESFANNNLRHLQREELHLSKKISISEVKSNFATSENITVLEGHILKKDVKRIKTALEQSLVDRFELNVSDAGSDAPIVLKNHPYAQNFVSLLKMYSLPRYGEFDPSSIMFIVFPIFFGFVLGDFFYGLLSLIFFTWFKFKKPQFRDFVSTLQLSSISSMIFGIIYGEFMGYELHGSLFGIPYGILNRAHDPETLLLYAIIFGALHINLGLIIGFFNHIKHIKDAVTHYLAWIIMEVGVGLLAFGYSYDLTAEKYIGWAVLLISMVLLVMGHGIMGIMEMPGIFGNILSYARLMAVGLSSVIIALLVNEFTHNFFSMGIFGIVGGILIFTIGHLFNIILGNFESFLHSLRLHYVEFFTKFYDGGGEEFIPFGKRK